MPEWGTRDLLGVAHGFREAAEAVYESLPGRPADVLYLPLQFLWRHHLELMLKANIAIWSGLSGSPAQAFGHDLRKLFGEYKNLGREVVGDEAEEDTLAAERALETFLALEPSHDASRYPGDRDGKRFDRPERVDLNELHKAAKAVSSLLGGAYDYADAMRQAMPNDLV